MSMELDAWEGPALALSTEELAEHHALERLCRIYALGFDMRDYDLARSAFADDAVIEGKEGFEPVDASLPKTYAIAASFAATQHFIANQYVKIDGSDAIVWSYGMAHHKPSGKDQREEIIAGVQYRDRCRKSAQGWLIVERKITNQWVDIGPCRNVM